MNQTELINHLKSLREHRAGGAVDVAWMSSTREILLSQIDPLGADKNRVDDRPSAATYHFYNFASLFGSYVARPVAGVVVVVLAFFGYSATVNVASASLPGDLFYPIKTTTEQVQLALTLAPEDKVSLKMDFVTRRSTELQQLVITREEEPEIIAETVQRIADDVQEVQEDLASISDQTSAEIIEVAKEIDSKTLVVNHDIIVTSNSLTEEVKQAVASEVQQAVDNTQSAGTAALAVIVDNLQSDNSIVSDEEVTTRISDRIKQAEEAVAIVSSEVSKIETATPVAPVVVATSTEPVASTTIQIIVAQSQQAQDTISEAKDLLEQKDFSSAIDKIIETKDVITALTPVMVGQDQLNQATAASSTETPVTATTSTSTSEQSE